MRFCVLEAITYNDCCFLLQIAAPKLRLLSEFPSLKSNIYTILNCRKKLLPHWNFNPGPLGHVYALLAELLRGCEFKYVLEMTLSFTALSKEEQIDRNLKQTTKLSIITFKFVV